MKSKSHIRPVSGASNAGVRKPKINLHQLAIEPHAGQWQSKEVREQVQEQIRLLAPLFRSDAAEYPADFRLRIARVALAMYVLDRLGDISRAARTPAEKTRAANVSRAASELLNEKFFSLDEDGLRRGAYTLYLRLSPLSRKLGIKLLNPEEAVNEYLPKLSKEIDSINGI